MLKISLIFIILQIWVRFYRALLFFHIGINFRVLTWDRARNLLFTEGCESVMEQRPPARSEHSRSALLF